MKIQRYIAALAILAACLLSGLARAQTPGFVQQDVIKVSGITTDSALYAQGPMQRQTVKTYADGMGRQLQSIAVEASPTEKDIIQPVAYDNLGRQTKAYLPYGGSTGDINGSYRSNAFTGAQAAFYDQTTQYVIPVDTAPYSQRVFENSPLQRLMDAGMDGTGFHPISGGHYKTANYRPNGSSDGNIMQWNADGSYTASTYYAANSLQVTDARDEDTVEVLTFSDYLGRTVLKRQVSGSTKYDTYYIYNTAGMLSYVAPPLAVSLMNPATSFNLNTAPFSNLVFNYIYNGRGQPAQRKIPGKGMMYIVYDPLNRPVLAQDSSMRVSKKWNYIKYDAKGRAISQGIYTDAAHTTLTAMQAHVDSLNYGTAWYETRTTNATKNNGGYYTNTIFPTTNITALAYAYFDDYNITGHTAPTFAYVAQHDVSLPGEESATTAMTKGMPTVVSKTTVGSGFTTAPWLTTVTFFDHNLRPIQVRSNNQLNYTNDTTLTDAKTVVNDFAGMPLCSKVTKKRTSTDTVSVYTKMVYDQVYRVDTVKQKYNTGPYNAVANYNYNEVGQLILKKLDSIGSNSWLQNVDYRYNIRGWLLSINNSKLTPDGGKTNNDSNDVFGMQLMYDKADSALRNRMRYDGKPSGVRWMTRNYHNTRTEERSYLYFYDGFNRYTAEGYAERDSMQVGSSAYSLNRGAFNEIVSYDAGGNISKLSRNSTKPTTGFYQIDTLTYSYSTANPNLLLSVTDGTDSVHTNHGFRNLTGGSTNYNYDGNGNLTTDAYKGIAKISYDVLNRTDTLKISSAQYITYTYDADGNLLRKKQYAGSTLQTTTDYIDGFVYLTQTTGTPALSYFPMPEGRVLDSLGTFTQEFIIADPQGNARVAFRKVGTTAKVWQENSYYGTGFILPNSPVSGPTVPNKKLYNGGSEWQNDYSNLPDYYQTFNRNYDAAIGRFISVDPAGESAESLTTYQYAGNNPIISNDPAGDRFDPNPPPSYAGMSEFNQGGDDSYYGNEFDYTALVSGLPDDDSSPDAISVAPAITADPSGDDSNEPLTTTGSYAVAAPSLLAQAREGATVIGEETIYGGQGIAGGGSTGPTGSGGAMIAASNDIAYSIMLADVNIGGVSLSGRVEINSLTAQFNVNGINASGLQIIQVYYGHGGSSGNLAFVDGGVNSPYAKQTGHPAQPGKPYYLTPDEFANGEAWSGSSGSIFMSDHQNGGYSNDVSTFEVILVATNYNGTGVDQLLGGFTWNYNLMQLSINGGQVIPSASYLLGTSDFHSNISNTAIQIIHNDYPGYTFTQ